LSLRGLGRPAFTRHQSFISDHSQSRHVHCRCSTPTLTILPFSIPGIGSALTKLTVRGPVRQHARSFDRRGFLTVKPKGGSTKLVPFQVPTNILSVDFDIPRDQIPNDQCDSLRQRPQGLRHDPDPSDPSSSAPCLTYHLVLRTTDACERARPSKLSKSPSTGPSALSPIP
jgi:hypothetical protein